MWILILIVFVAACYGIAGIISMFGVDIEIAFYITTFVIIFGGIFVLLCCRKLIEKIPDKVDKAIVTSLKVIIPILAILGVIFAFTGDDSDNSIDDTTPKKYTACENRSDAYHKCSWSGWENRCVCKQR